MAINIELIKHLENFLSDELTFHLNHVAVDGISSKTFVIKAGVQQGSVLTLVIKFKILQVTVA